MGVQVRKHNFCTLFPLFLGGVKDSRKNMTWKTNSLQSLQSCNIIAPLTLECLLLPDTLSTIQVVFKK